MAIVRHLIGVYGRVLLEFPDIYTMYAYRYLLCCCQKGKEEYDRA